MSTHGESQFRREKSEGEAARWASRLESGQPTSSDLDALNAWLRESPDHRRLLGQYVEMSDAFESALPPKGGSPDVEQLVARVASGEKLKRRAWIGLSLAAVLVVGGALWSMRPESVMTGPGERRVVRLRDGSQVELNAQTALDVDLGSRARRVRLIRGEAVFSVAPDAARPFHVDLDEGRVQVLGTTFNVLRTSDSAPVTVTILEGRVQVQPAGVGSAPLILSGGNQAELTRGAVSSHPMTAEQMRNLTAWRSGLAAFESASLREASELYARYHGWRIEMDDDVAGLRVGGRYSLDDIEGYLAAVEETLPVRVTRKAAGVIRLQRR